MEELSRFLAILCFCYLLARQNNKAAIRPQLTRVDLFFWCKRETGSNVLYYYFSNIANIHHYLLYSQYFLTPSKSEIYFRASFLLALFLTGINDKLLSFLLALFLSGTNSKLFLLVLLALFLPGTNGELLLFLLLALFLSGINCELLALFQSKINIELFKRLLLAFFL